MSLQITVKEEKDFKKIFQAADAAECELTKLDTITPCFIAKDQTGASIGIIGFRTGFKEYWIFDLAGVLPNKRNKGVEEKLLEFAKKYAKQKGIKTFYMIMSDKWLSFFKKAGASEITLEKLPKRFFSSCFSCKMRGKECFPVPLVWRL